MLQIQIALPIARNLTSLHFYGTSLAPGDQTEQRPRGSIFIWHHSRKCPHQLANLGLDICGVGRWQQMLLRVPEIATRAFTDSERRWAGTQPERLAMLWAIKEAFVKALGCGFDGLAYRDIGIEFSPLCPIILLPATVHVDISRRQEISDLSWQLVLFRQNELFVALILAWQDAEEEFRELSSTQDTLHVHANETDFCSKVVLELRPITVAQQSTRREKYVAERLAARQAAYSAASRLLPHATCHHISISKTQRGRPLLQVDAHNRMTADSLPLSLSHCSGWAAAALGERA
jgi:phosphopantetheinyl transferase (holo-ACP synthase)